MWKIAGTLTCKCSPPLPYVIYLSLYLMSFLSFISALSGIMCRCAYTVGSLVFYFTLVGLEEHAWKTGDGHAKTFLGSVCVMVFGYCFICLSFIAESSLPSSPCALTKMVGTWFPQAMFQTLSTVHEVDSSTVQSFSFFLKHTFSSFSTFCIAFTICSVKKGAVANAPACCVGGVYMLLSMPHYLAKVNFFSLVTVCFCSFSCARAVFSC